MITCASNNVSKTSNRSNSQWVQACVLLLTVAILPLGLAIAGEGQRAAEYRAIGARIRAIVEAGEISQEDAEKRLVAARKHIFEYKQSSIANESVMTHLFGRKQLPYQSNKMKAFQRDNTKLCLRI